jgi:hypothetical protein
MNNLQITIPESEAKEAWVAADAIFGSLSGAQRRALADEISVLFLYLTSQTCKRRPNANPEAVLCRVG